MGDATASQNRFFEQDYSEALQRMIFSVIEVQGPIRDDALAREVARAHGFARTTNRIKQRVMDLASNTTTTEESVGKFYWSASPSMCVSFRYPAANDERRSLEEIPIQELIGLVREHFILTTGDDPAVALARQIGLARLTNPSRARLEEAIGASADIGYLNSDGIATS